MKPGHVFTIEPMINEGSWQDVLWPDDWTSVTKDGKRSAQFEHTLLVTDTGCEVQNISLTQKIMIILGFDRKKVIPSRFFFDIG